MLLYIKTMLIIYSTLAHIQPVEKGLMRILKGKLYYGDIMGICRLKPTHRKLKTKQVSLVKAIGTCNIKYVHLQGYLISKLKLIDLSYLTVPFKLD